MSDNMEDVVKGNSVNINKEQYWKMYADMGDLAHAKTRLREKELEYRVKQLEVGLAQKFLECAKLNLIEERESYRKSEKLYENAREELEKELGTSLSDATLNPFTGNIERIQNGTD